MSTPFLGSASDLTAAQLRGKQYRQVFADVYVIGEHTLSLRTKVDSALLLFPKAVVCLTTAALLLKLPVDDDGLIHLDRGARAPRSEREGIATHRFGIPESRIHVLDGLRVSSAARGPLRLDEPGAAGGSGRRRAQALGRR